MIKTAIIGAVLSAGTAQAGLSECAFEEGHHHASSHRDIGGGFVTYEQSYLGQNSGSKQHVIENCATGDRVLTVMIDHVGGGQDRTETVRKEFETMLRSPDAFDPDSVRQRMRGLGAKSENSKWDRQSCACAAAYPEMRGDKETYKKVN